jgi:hypothetical protein
MQCEYTYGVPRGMGSYTYAACLSESEAGESRARFFFVFLFSTRNAHTSSYYTDCLPPACLCKADMGLGPSQLGLACL